MKKNNEIELLMLLWALAMIFAYKSNFYVSLIIYISYIIYALKIGLISSYKKSTLFTFICVPFMYVVMYIDKIMLLNGGLRIAVSVPILIVYVITFTKIHDDSKK